LDPAEGFLKKAFFHHDDIDLWRFCQSFREVLSLLQGMKEQLETEVHFGKWWISGLHQDLPGDIHQVSSRVCGYRVGQ